MRPIPIHIHYVYSADAVAAKLPYATEGHRVETVLYGGHGWEHCVTESYVKLLNADYCWLSDLNDNPFFIVKNREHPYYESD